jgi:hypothetical protein
MWSALSGDFDQRLNAGQCLNNVMKQVRNGSVIVFHDSEKAWPRLSGCLEEVLKKSTSMGYLISAI